MRGAPKSTTAIRMTATEAAQTAANRLTRLRWRRRTASITSKSGSMSATESSMAFRSRSSRSLIRFARLPYSDVPDWRLAGQLTQADKRTRRLAPDRRDVAVQRRCDLAVREIFPVPHHQDCALPRRQAPQRTQQKVAVFDLSSASVHRQVHRGCPKRLLCSALQPAPPVDRGVHQHPPDIRLGGAALPEQEPATAIGTFKRDLEQVLGLSAVPAAEHERQPEQMRGLPAHELFECRASVHGRW